MAKKFLTDVQVEEEIARLTKSPYVRLAKMQERIKNQRRQYLYSLRTLEKKGKALYESGITDEESIMRDLYGDEFDEI